MYMIFSFTENVIESATMPLLAIAWDQQVQVAKLVKSELKLHAKWTLDSSAIGIAWLDDQVIVFAFLFLHSLNN